MSLGSRLLLLGLKGSGKTSYLAALWHLIEAGELPASLQAAKLQPDREYLNRIRDNWLRFKEVGRTPTGTHEILTLNLADVSTGHDVVLTVPDMSGESQQNQWLERQASTAYVEFTKESFGLLLFIHPESIKRPMRVSVVPSTSVGTPAPAEAQKLTQWSPKLSPTQIQVVELLQFALALRPPYSPFRIAVIISAWDRIKGKIYPSSWVEHRLPLLHQYLTANNHVVPFKIFGVSALGGDLTQDLDALASKTTPSTRIRVIDDRLAESHDLTAPLRYLLALDRLNDPA